jgi:type III restriction enzyme
MFLDQSMNSPIINSPYLEPSRHFSSDERGLTDVAVDGRRKSTLYVPVPRAKEQSKREEQVLADGAYGSELERENVFVNKVRDRLQGWRMSGWPGLTKVSRDLLSYWQDPNRENKLFFCQIEALEALMWLTEVAPKSGDVWAINEIKKVNDEANPGLFRLAYKMATVRWSGLSRQ